MLVEGRARVRQDGRKARPNEREIVRRRQRGILLLVLVTLLSVAGCTGGGGRFVDPKSSGGSAAGPALGVTPADKATDVPVSIEVGLGQGGKVQSVELTAGGKAVTGKPREDGSPWGPVEPPDLNTHEPAQGTG